MKSIGVITDSRNASLHKSDRLLIPLFERMDYSTHIISWDNNPDLSDLHSILFRSCWNYPTHITAFTYFLDTIEQFSGSVYNSLDLIKWNLHKRYLVDLSKMGVTTMPTRLITNPENLKSQLEIESWKSFVLKPAIGNNSMDVRVFESDHIEHAITHLEIHKQVEWLFQPYIEAAHIQGEYQLIFFNGRFSHAVHKKMKNVSLFEEVPVTMIRWASNTLQHLPQIPLYARVDCVPYNNTFILMELELIEPMLYLDLYPPGAALFCQEYQQRLLT